jgi:hypothetical protein
MRRHLDRVALEHVPEHLTLAERQGTPPAATGAGGRVRHIEDAVSSAFQPSRFTGAPSSSARCRIGAVEVSSRSGPTRLPSPVSPVRASRAGG